MCASGIDRLWSAIDKSGGHPLCSEDHVEETPAPAEPVDDGLR